MADLINDNKTISRNNEGFPEYLDFDTLRSEAIQHLGNLSGKIWTDHNVHDPGITILEALIYALLDLGYRSNLPSVDIFARNPEETGPDNNFLTPAQLLGCNPLTILDFRKLLADLPLVRNAWLEPATDVDRSDFCFDQRKRADQNCCDTFINGLYHVFVELEPSVETDDQRNEALAQIRETLMKHRNLCEDFIDIKILCRKKVGICVKLELENGTDVEKLYFEMINVLQDFLNPKPKFYTLQQLLDKNKSIDEIFAGRPMDLKDSHGFLDTEEFESIRLKKSIHISDLYGLLLQVKGIRQVKSLNLQTCDGVDLKFRNGSYLLPQFHIPELDLDCSGFAFYRDGVQLSFDTTQINKLLQLGSNGKIQFKSPSPYLDSEIPKGIYRADLDDYYSIQNEFPRVYGIGEGDLSNDAPAKRVAWARQLKGFLLFFDQMLANYLSQLKNIRSLFSLSVPGSADQQHTYFVNKLSTVPDLKDLLRFPVEDGIVDGLGTTGSMLAFPFSKSQWMQWEESGELKKKNIEKLEPFAYNSIDDRKTGVQTWINDVFRDSIETHVITKDNDCVYFYLNSPSNDFVLISKKYYKNEQEARNAAATILYLASLESNYRSYFVPENQTYTFNLELNLADYGSYLQDIAETPEQYAGRRRVFLRHLLARFAEQFTDYALLSYGFLNAEELEKKNAAFGERFLNNYSDISSNRGRAYDYQTNGWDNDNISGFEKRFKALSGIEDLSKHSLCNFEVVELDAKFVYKLSLGGRELFASKTDYSSREKAAEAAQELFLAISDKSNLSAQYIEYDKVYAVEINAPSNDCLQLREKFQSKEEAEKVTEQLPEIFGEKATTSDVFIASYQYFPRIRNNDRKIVRAFVKVSEDEEEIRKAALEAIAQTEDPNTWKEGEIANTRIGKLLHNQQDSTIFLDLNDFKIDVNNTIVDKPELFTYELLDRKNQFKFSAINEFENDKAAQEDSHLLLQLLMDEKNVAIIQDKESQKFHLQVNDRNTPLAATTTQYNSLPEAEKARTIIRKIIDGYRYHLTVDKLPYTYKFSYQLGYGDKRNFRFNSVPKYFSEEEAMKAAQGFIDAVNSLQLKWNASSNEVLLAHSKNKEQSTLLINRTVSDEAAFKQLHQNIQQELDLQKEIHQLRTANSSKEFIQYTDRDSLSRLGQYVYRLVDKDGKLARYLPPAPEKSRPLMWRKEVAERVRESYIYLQICLSGDNIIQRTDGKCGESAWFYQIKASGHYYSKGEGAEQELVMFESVKGYASAEEAARAFDANYMAILEYASDKKNYGKGKPISLDPSVQQMNDQGLHNAPLVFVPEATIEEFGGDEAQTIEALVKMALSYPVRRILFSDKKGSDWQKYFECNSQPDFPPAATTCEANEEHWFYCFLLRGTDKEKNIIDEWISTHYYDDPEKAWKDLQFVLLLLKYEGNYTTDCACDGSTRIYIREVLAQSVDRFPDKQTAWGQEGVEKFIAVSQKAGSFHTFQESCHCCYSFYVACENQRLKFGCNYDTVRSRDEAIDKIYNKYKKLDEDQPFSIDYVNERYELKDKEGKAIAILHLQKTAEYNRKEAIHEAIQFCSWSDLILAIDIDENYKEEKEKKAYYLADDNGSILASPVEQNMSLDQWKTALRMVSGFYQSMIRIEYDANENPIRYCIELDKRAKDPMDHYEQPAALRRLRYEPTDEDDTCSTVQSGCCFTVKQDVKKIKNSAAREALEYLLQAIGMLKNHLFYQRVFDCVCEGYRIHLHGKHALMPQPVCLSGNRPWIGIPDENRILAYNPNCYNSPEQACESVVRAKKLINSEGLHLVEHILLRPRCEPVNDINDCGCNLRPNYEGWNDCKFPYWKTGNENDPCDQQLPVCFEPGTDPYSFIATVVMPAWPERFRKKENRAMLEMMLQREAPAHVMLRVLWLTPHDFCCIEQAYRSWNRWLTQDGYCYDADAACKLIDLLFNQPLDCLKDQNVCETCSTGTTTTNICDKPMPAHEREIKCKDRSEMYKAINSLFNWRTGQADGYEFFDCERDYSRAHEISTLPAKEQEIKKKLADHVRPESKREKELKEEKDKAAAKSKPEVIPPVKKKTEISGTEKTPIDNRKKASVINARHTARQKVLNDLLATTGNNAVIKDAARFLAKRTPAPAEFNTLIKKIFANQTVKGKKKKAEAKWADEVAGELTLHFLDTHAFELKDLSAVAEAKPSFDQMKKSGIDLAKLFKKWDAAIAELEPALKTNTVKKLMQ